MNERGRVVYKNEVNWGGGGVRKKSVGRRLRLK